MNGRSRTSFYLCASSLHGRDVPFVFGVKRRRTNEKKVQSNFRNVCVCVWKYVGNPWKKGNRKKRTNNSNNNNNKQNNIDHT